MIAANRWAARHLRTQAPVVAVLTTGRRARGASVPHCLIFFLEGQVPSIHYQGMRSGEACSRLECGPEDGETGTNARIRSRCPVLRSPAVVRRRQGPRHVFKSRERPSASSALSALSALSAVRLRWLCALSVSLCLCGSTGEQIGTETDAGRSPRHGREVRAMVPAREEFQ